MEEIRCIHRGRNKIGFFSKLLVEDAHWRKQTGWEPQPLPKAEMPETITPSQPDELHAKPEKRKRGRQPKAKPTTA